MDGEGKVIMRIRNFVAAGFTLRWGPSRLWLANAYRQGTIEDGDNSQQAQTRRTTCNVNT